MRMRKKLLALVLCGTLACAAIPTIIQDITNIATIVFNDIENHVPFLQVLTDTGSADASLLIAIITSLENDPNLAAAQRAKYTTDCQPYLTQAIALYGTQHPGKPLPVPVAIDAQRVVHAF